MPETTAVTSVRPIRKLMVANRSEIAIRVFRSAHELGIRTVAIYAYEVFLNKSIPRARHIEVQLVGDRHDNLAHLFERDCSLQHRRQKVVKLAPNLYDATRHHYQRFV